MRNSLRDVDPLRHSNGSFAFATHLVGRAQLIEYGRRGRRHPFQRRDRLCRPPGLRVLASLGECDLVRRWRRHWLLPLRLRDEAAGERRPRSAVMGRVMRDVIHLDREAGYHDLVQTTRCRITACAASRPTLGELKKRGLDALEVLTGLPSGYGSEKRSTRRSWALRLTQASPCETAGLKPLRKHARRAGLKPRATRSPAAAQACSCVVSRWTVSQEGIQAPACDPHTVAAERDRSRGGVSSAADDGGQMFDYSTLVKVVLVSRAG